MDNDTILTNISKLGSMSTAIGCEAMRQLETESGKSKEVYAHLDKLFTLLDDRNPYARTRAFVRQCIQSLPLIAAAKPGLRQRIAEALRAINPEKYPVRMRSILTEDIKIALAAAEK